MAKAYTKALLKDKNSPDISLQQPVVGHNLMVKAYMETLLKDKVIMTTLSLRYPIASSHPDS